LGTKTEYEVQKRLLKAECPVANVGSGSMLEDNMILVVQQVQKFLHPEKKQRGRKTGCQKFCRIWGTWQIFQSRESTQKRYWEPNLHINELFLGQRRRVVKPETAQNHGMGPAKEGEPL